MDSTVEIHDDFSELSPAERSEAMTSFLTEFGEHMKDHNRRILARVLNMISATEGDDKLHLNMLATHLDKETTLYMDVKEWPGENEEYREICRLNDFMSQSCVGEDAGVCPWEHDSKNYVAKFLLDLETAVRKNASRELLGSAADTLELPAEFCELLIHTAGVFYPNLDRQMFVCPFGKPLYNADKQAEALEKMCERASSGGFEVAAGWKVGENYYNCWIYYLLCKDPDEPEESWQWRIFINNIEYADCECYDSMHDFLSWYCEPYDWIEWDSVQASVNKLHLKCKEALERQD